MVDTINTARTALLIRPWSHAISDLSRLCRCPLNRVLSWRFPDHEISSHCGASFPSGSSIQRILDPPVGDSALASTEVTLILKRLRRLALILTVPICMVLLAPSAAHAHWEGTERGRRIDQGFDPGLNSQKCIVSLVSQDKACYRRNNDTFRVYDWTSDGMRVGVEWRAHYGDMGPPPSPRRGLCWHKQPSGQFGPWTGVCDKNFPKAGR